MAAAIRRAIHNNQASLRELAKRYDLNPKAVATWRKRTSVHDMPMGPEHPASTVLTGDEEAIIVAFRRRTLLPLDDCLYALQASSPHLSRSALHRCLVRHGLSRLPEVRNKKAPKKRFKRYPIGLFRIDIAVLRTDEGKRYLFVAIDRTRKFAYAELHPAANKLVAAQFLRNLILKVPYKIHTVLTDNGIQFTNRQRDRHAFRHIFDRVCAENDIEHRLTRVHHPWTNGQVERMNRALKDATVNRNHDETHQQLKEHLEAFLMAYNYAKRLKTLRGLTHYEYTCACWQKESQRFTINPLHHTLGPNI